MPKVRSRGEEKKTRGGEGEGGALILSGTLDNSYSLMIQLPI